MHSTKVWHPFDVIEIEKNLKIVHAEGVFLYTSDGQKIIDAISSWWVNLHGHNHPVLNQALFGQINLFSHTLFAGFTHENAEILSQKLCEIIPGKADKIFFSDDGSTAVEVALKMSLQYWYNKGQRQKKKFIAFKDAYHGDTFGSMSVGGRSPFNAAFDNLLFETEFIELPSNDNINRVSDSFHQLIASGNIAGFIFEPLVQGAAGMRMYKAEHLDRLLNIAKNNEVICISDEVMTGFGRTGTTFASEQLQIKPDIFCLSKGLTGGYLPLGVTSCSQEIYNQFHTGDYFKNFFHGHSYTANPLACAVAVASLKLLQSEEVQTQIHSLASHLTEIKIVISEEGVFEDVQHKGGILSFSYKNNLPSNYSNPLRNKLYHYFLSKNILLRPLGNRMYLIPPYCISKDELNYIQEVILGLKEARF